MHIAKANATAASHLFPGHLPRSVIREGRGAAMRFNEERIAKNVRRDCCPSRNECAVLGARLGFVCRTALRAFRAISRCTACNTSRLHGHLFARCSGGPSHIKAVRTTYPCPYVPHLAREAHSPPARWPRTHPVPI